nr:immunoglobulin heavy chain junction region [Homo sapiens]
AADTAVYYCAR